MSATSLWSPFTEKMYTFISLIVSASAHIILQWTWSKTLKNRCVFRVLDMAKFTLVITLYLRMRNLCKCMKWVNNLSVCLKLLCTPGMLFPWRMCLSVKLWHSQIDIKVVILFIYFFSIFTKLPVLIVKQCLKRVYIWWGDRGGLHPVSFVVTILDQTSTPTPSSRCHKTGRAESRSPQQVSDNSTRKTRDKVDVWMMGLSE